MAQKKQGNFYGSKIRTGKLHRTMHVSPGKNIPEKRVSKSLSSVKKQIHNAPKGSAKRKALVTKERELTFANNAKTGKFGHRKSKRR